MPRSSPALALTVLLSLAVTLPFFNFMRTVPSPDWWTHAVTLLCLNGVLLGSLLSSASVNWSRGFLLLLLWWLCVFLPWFLHQSGNLYQLPLSEALATLFVIVAAAQAGSLQEKLGRERLVTVLAAAILLAALLQALIGYLQLLGVAPLAHGWLLFDPANPQSNIMGNIAQRNQFAQFLTWGVLAAAYLFIKHHLRLWLTVPAILFLVTVMAWSGGRLPLAYAGAMLVVALVWYRHSNDRRLLKALLLAAVAMLGAQLWGQYVAHWLTGLDIASGLDRLDAAGFGARRRIEWMKAWQVVQAYPWFGVGFGGFAYQSVWLEAFAGYDKIPENALFTHSHNLIAQLLAETGVPATLLAAAVCIVCLLPYWKKEQATAENAFLTLVAAAILGHSMFEYPLWYLPFLTMFFIILVLSPAAGIEVPVRPLLRKLGVVLLLLGGVAYLVNGVQTFRVLQTALQPVRGQQDNYQRVETLLGISSNPFWSYEAEIGLSSYLQPSKKDLLVKRRHYEQLVAYRPYPQLLCNLAMLRYWSGDAQGAQDLVIMALATYPANASLVLSRLQSADDPGMQPMIDIARKAVQAYQRGGDKAAAEAATQGLPVRGPQLPDLSRFR